MLNIDTDCLLEACLVTDLWAHRRNNGRDHYHGQGLDDTRQTCGQGTTEHSALHAWVTAFMR